MITSSIDIKASPDRVFHWLDDSQRVMEWVPNVTLTEDLEVTPERVGSTFRQVYGENGRPMEFQGKVTAYEKNRRLAIHMVGPFFDLAVDYRLEDREGGTRLTQQSDIKFKGFFKIISPLMNVVTKKAGKKDIDASFERLRNLAEG